MRSLILRSSQRGQSMVEFSIVFLLFLVLMGGVVEMTYMYRTKHMFNTASFEAARAGALNHALPRAMSDTLARNMAPIYMRSDRSSEGLARAMVEAEGIRRAIDASGNAIALISPSRGTFNALGVEQKLRLQTEPEDARPTKRKVLPKDNLIWRPRKEVDADGGRVNVQDANVLKIGTYWCHRLVVPVVDRLVYELAGTVNGTRPEQLACQALSQGGRYYVLIASKSTVHMQTPIVREAYES